MSPLLPWKSQNIKEISPKKVLLFMDYLQEKRHRDVTWWFENFVCHWAHTGLGMGN